jgi:hypothetical protein
MAHPARGPRAGVVVDGAFGPATEAAVRAFQRRRSLPATGIVDRATFDALVAPMRRAVAAAEVTSTLGRTVVAVARRHLAEKPREAGGANRGPWVRLYMDGNEGKDWPWCAGFATWVIRQAAEAHAVPSPVARTWSCDELAGRAKARDCLCRGTPTARAQVTPGSLFLSRQSSSDWTHVGIVLRALPDHFETIEGNTNDDGSREGHEVVRRTRSWDGKDFVIVA